MALCHRSTNQSLAFPIIFTIGCKWLAIVSSCLSLQTICSKRGDVRLHFLSELFRPLDQGLHCLTITAIIAIAILVIEVEFSVKRSWYWSQQNGKFQEVLSVSTRILLSLVYLFLCPYFHHRSSNIKGFKKSIIDLMGSQLNIDP